MTKYFTTNHRQVRTESAYECICDVMTFSGWTVSLLHEGIEQAEAQKIIEVLKAKDEKEAE